MRTDEGILTEIHQCLIVCVCVLPQMCCCSATLTKIRTGHLRPGGNVPSQQTAGCGNKMQSAAVPGSASLWGCVAHGSTISARSLLGVSHSGPGTPGVLLCCLHAWTEREMGKGVRRGLRELGPLDLIRPALQAPRPWEAFASICLHDKGC